MKNMQEFMPRHITLRILSRTRTESPSVLLTTSKPAQNYNYVIFGKWNIQAY